MLTKFHYTEAKADNYSSWLVNANAELQWQDVYYRGYYELYISYTDVKAQYFGTPTLVQRLPLEVSLANFTVPRGANALQRPVGGGIVASGALKNGQTIVSNITHNTLTGEYRVSQLEMFGYGQSPNA
jgi:alkaline phosphatase D